MLTLVAALVAIGAAADPETPRDLAKLAIVQGPIDVGGAAPKVGDPVDAGAVIKTPAGSRAVYDFPDGTELRINENTELSVEGPRKISLKQGKVFMKVVKSGANFEIHTPHMPVVVGQALLEVEFIPRVPNGDPAHTYVRVLDGTAKATTPKFNTNVFAGFYITGLGSQLNTPDPLRNGSLETAWIQPLLVERGRTDEETQTRAMEMVQALGREPDAETALRSLGDLGTAELVRFLNKSVGNPQPARRTTAARIIAETGTTKSAAGLVSLLQYPEPEIRTVAARGLARLAGGKDLGFNEQYWKGESRDAGQKAWEDWLKQVAK
jgi:hypothetical protein